VNHISDAHHCPDVCVFKAGVFAIWFLFLMVVAVVDGYLMLGLAMACGPPMTVSTSQSRSMEPLR
jgi:hypothetical protein